MSEKRRHLPRLSTSGLTTVKRSVTGPKKKIGLTQSKSKCSTHESMKTKDIEQSVYVASPKNNVELSESSVFDHRFGCRVAIDVSSSSHITESGSSSSQQTELPKYKAHRPILPRDENNAVATRTRNILDHASSFLNKGEQKVFTSRGAIPKVFKRDGEEISPTASYETSSNSNDGCYAQFVQHTGSKLETLSVTPSSEIAFLREYESYLRDSKGFYYRQPLNIPPNTPASGPSLADTEQACHSGNVNAQTNRSFSSEAEVELFVSSPNKSEEIRHKGQSVEHVLMVSNKTSDSRQQNVQQYTNNNNYNDQPFDARNRRDNNNVEIVNDKERGQRQDDNKHCRCCCNCHTTSTESSRSNSQRQIERNARNFAVRNRFEKEYREYRQRLRAAMAGGIRQSVRQTLITRKSSSLLEDSTPFQLPVSSNLSKPLPQETVCLKTPNLEQANKTHISQSPVKMQRATGGKDKPLTNAQNNNDVTSKIKQKTPTTNLSYIVQNSASKANKKVGEFIENRKLKVRCLQENNVEEHSSVQIIYEPPTQEANRYFQSSRSSVSYDTYSLLDSPTTMNSDKADYHFSSCSIDTISWDINSTQGESTEMSMSDEVDKPLGFIITAIPLKDGVMNATELDETTVPRNGRNSVLIESKNRGLLSFVRDQLVTHIRGARVNISDSDMSGIENASRTSGSESAKSKDSSKFISLVMISSTDTEQFQIKHASRICENKSTQTYLKCFCKEKCMQNSEKKYEKYENIQKYQNDKKDKTVQNYQNDKKYNNVQKYQNDKKDKNVQKYQNDKKDNNVQKYQDDKRDHNNQNHKNDVTVKMYQNGKQDHKDHKTDKRNKCQFTFIRPNKNMFSSYTRESVSQRFKTTPNSSVTSGSGMIEPHGKCLSEEHFKRLKMKTEAFFNKKPKKSLLPNAVKYKMRCALLATSSRDPVLLRFERQQQRFFKKLMHSKLTELEIIRGICQLIPNVDYMSKDQITSDRYPIMDAGILFYLMRLYNARFVGDSYHMQAYMLDGYYAADMLLNQGIPAVLPPKNLVGVASGKDGANDDGGDGEIATKDGRESAAEGGGGAVKCVGATDASVITKNAVKRDGESNYFNAKVLNTIPAHILRYLDLKLYDYINEQDQLNRHLHKTHMDVNELLCFYMISSYYRTLLRRYERGDDAKKASFAVTVFETYIMERERRCGRIQFEDLYAWIRTHETLVISIDFRVRIDVRLKCLKRLNNNEIVHVINMHVFRHFERNKALPQPDVLAISHQKKPKKNNKKLHSTDEKINSHKCPIASCRMKLACTTYMAHLLRTHTSLHEELRCRERAVHFMHPRLYPGAMQVYCISMLGLHCDGFAGNEANELPMLNTELPPGCEDYAHLQPVSLMYCQTKKLPLEYQPPPLRKFDMNGTIYLFWLMAPNMSLHNFNVTSINCKLAAYNMSMSMSEGPSKVLRVLEHSEFFDILSLLLYNYDDCFVIDFRQMVGLTKNFSSLFCLDLTFSRDTI